MPPWSTTQAPLSATGFKRKATNLIRMKASLPAAMAPLSFAELQQRLSADVDNTDGSAAPWDVLVVPSLNLDAQQIALVQGVHHYEERQLFELIRLRQPKARMVSVTSKLLPELVVDAVLELLPGVPISMRANGSNSSTPMTPAPSPWRPNCWSGRACCNASARC